MTFSVAVVLGIVALAFVLFASERVPIAQVAMAIPAALMLTRILTPQQALSGFSSEATLTVAAMLVLSLALTHTGLVRDVANAAQRFKVVGKRGRLILLTVLAASISPFLNNTAVVAVFLPVFVTLARKDGEPASLYLMPLSFAAILGGTVTLIGTSTNLVVAGIAHRRGLDELHMFSIAPLGLVVVGIGMVYLWTVGAWLLPRRDGGSELLEHYGVRSYLTELTVEAGSKLIGQDPETLDWHEIHEVEVVGLYPRGLYLRRLHQTIQEGDVVLVRGEAEDILVIAHEYRLSVPREGSKGGMTVEVLVGPGASVIGRSLRDSRFEEVHGAVVLAVQRPEEVTVRRLRDVVLRVGDLLLVRGEADVLSALVERPGFIGLDVVEAGSPRPGRWIAAATLFTVVAAAGLGVSGILAASVVGAVFVVFVGCVRLEQVYQDLDWGVVFLLAGTIPLGIAVEESGAAAWLSDVLVGPLSGLGPVLVVALLYGFTSLLTEVMSNNAAAIVLTPIALQLAERLEMNPYALVVTVMFGASAAFMSPMGYQTNTMVCGPGGYRFTDYVRVGGPLNLLLLIVVSIAIPMLWP